MEPSKNASFLSSLQVEDFTDEPEDRARHHLARAGTTSVNSFCVLPSQRPETCPPASSSACRHDNESASVVCVSDTGSSSTQVEPAFHFQQGRVHRALPSPAESFYENLFCSQRQLLHATGIPSQSSQHSCSLRPLTPCARPGKVSAPRSGFAQDSIGEVNGTLYQSLERNEDLSDPQSLKTCTPNPSPVTQGTSFPNERIATLHQDLNPFFSARGCPPANHQATYPSSFHSPEASSSSSLSSASPTSSLQSSPFPRNDIHSCPTAYNSGYSPQLFSPHGATIRSVGGQRRGYGQGSSLPAASSTAVPQLSGGFVAEQPEFPLFQPPSHDPALRPVVMETTCNGTPPLQIPLQQAQMVTTGPWYPSPPDSLPSPRVLFSASVCNGNGGRFPDGQLNVEARQVAEHADCFEPMTSLDLPSSDCGRFTGGALGSDVGPKVYLSNADLWRCFSCHGTEMIITKQGRLMFPPLEIRVTGLEPDKLYTCLVDVVPLASNPWKYVNNRWTQLNPPFQMAAGGDQVDPPPFIKISGLDAVLPVMDGHVDGLHIKDCAFNRLFVHPDSPSTGQDWMKPQGVVFNKLKLTNSKDNPQNLVVLKSMHMYQPRIHVLEVAEDRTRVERAVVSVTFPETRFVCVTSYQNTDITELKVRLNKYARGSRSESLQNMPVFNTTVLSNRSRQSTATCHQPTDFGFTQRHCQDYQVHKVNRACSKGGQTNPYLAPLGSAVHPPAATTPLGHVQHPVTSSSLGPFGGFYPRTTLGSAQLPHMATNPGFVLRRELGYLPAQVGFSSHPARAGAEQMSVSSAHRARFAFSEECRFLAGRPAAASVLATAPEDHRRVFLQQQFLLPLDVADGTQGIRKRRGTSAMARPELARTQNDQRISEALPAKRICLVELSPRSAVSPRSCSSIVASSKKPEATVATASATSETLDHCPLANDDKPSQTQLQQQQLAGAASCSRKGKLTSKSDPRNPLSSEVQLAGPVSAEMGVSVSAAALVSILDDFQPVSDQAEHVQSCEDFGDEFLGLLKVESSVVTSDVSDTNEQVSSDVSDTNVQVASDVSDTTVQVTADFSNDSSVSASEVCNNPSEVIPDSSSNLCAVTTDASRNLT